MLIRKCIKLYHSRQYVPCISYVVKAETSEISLYSLFLKRSRNNLTYTDTFITNTYRYSTDYSTWQGLGLNGHKIAFKHSWKYRKLLC